MKFNLVYTTPLEPPVAQARAGEYLAKAGYRHEMGSAAYERGSKLSSRFAWKIQGCHALASLKAEPCQEGSLLNLALDVDNQGQWVTGRDKQQWEKELVELGEAVKAQNTRGTFTPWPITIYTGFVTVGFAFLGALFGGVWGYTLAHSLFLTLLVAFLGLTILGGVGLRYDKAKAKKDMSLLPGVLPRRPGAVSTESDVAAGQPGEASEISPLEWNMRKEIRSWALWCGVLGALNILTSGLSSAWGATLLLVAVASLVFQAPAMFVLYGITLVWVAIYNLTGGQTQWILFALMQFYFAFRVFKDFRRFRPVLDLYRPRADGLPAPQPQPVMGRPAKIFPWLGAALSGGSLLGLILCFAIMVFFSHTPAYASYKNGIYFLIDFTVDIGMFGLALGVGSLLSRYRFKAVSILAIALGGLVTAIILLLIVLG